MRNIDIYEMPNGVVFGTKAVGKIQTLATLKADDGVLKIFEPLDAGEESFINFAVKYYPIGTMLMLKRGKVSPSSAFQHSPPDRVRIGYSLAAENELEFGLVLRGYGNPDHGQFSDVAPKTYLRLRTLEECRREFRAHVSVHNLGAGNLGPESGVCYRLGKGRPKKLGRFSYSGNFFENP